MTGPVTDADLARWRELARKATAGPWHLFTNRHDHDGQRWGVLARELHPAGGAPKGLFGGSRGMWEGEQERADAEFIAAARDAVPRLLARIERVLALCDRADFERDIFAGSLGTGAPPTGEPWIRVADVRAALGCGA